MKCRSANATSGVRPRGFCGISTSEFTLLERAVLSHRFRDRLAAAGMLRFSWKMWGARRRLNAVATKLMGRPVFVRLVVAGLALVTLATATAPSIAADIQV